MAVSESVQPASEGSPRRRRVRAIIVWSVLLSLMLPVAVVGFYVLFESSQETSIDAAQQRLAEANAGGPVHAFTGSEHTVYQSVAPLPTDGSPRSDGLPTLVWFTSTSCADCHRMDAFVQQTAQKFHAQAPFVEKSLERDTSAQRYGVTSVPAFVLIDARGSELARFGYQPTAQAFEESITSALSANH